jgi:hypothetical protein
MRTAVLICVLFALPLAAERDFLTADEADQIREAQLPAERLTLYAAFARSRIKLVQQLLSKDKAGRSILVHDALEDYSNIIDAIDDVVDDAIKRNQEVKLGLDSVAAMEKETLPILQRVDSSRPKDLERYAFVLQQAIQTTDDSLQESQQDVHARKAELEAREAREKKELESMMGTKEVAVKHADEKKTADDEKKQRKAPTLRRKGEAVPPQ